MSWLFGYPAKKQEDSTSTATTSTSQIDSQLGFDASTISDVSSIISTPGGLDSSRLHPLAGLDKGIEYLDLEDESLNAIEGSQSLLPSRGWSDDLCYGAGTVYLAGLTVGGAQGFLEGLGKINRSDPGKLRLNTVLNAVTKRGPFLGNNAGVLAILYNLSCSTIDGVRGKHDGFNSVAAGALSGAFFKCTKGVKQMAYASAIMAGVSGAWVGFKASLGY
ncbi:hypothetical protein WICPIJ_000588 [Wickerhamomyces pijperi]|uniref:Mitochondrial import inner membrane translocase subunit TIM23 n=1 Tax=Wickerhamomyces pijperi TaxID=599730 RepID=A0A9P8QGM5_WICPI|nr:hypothetical protein WICPIJ_000588 [Wickerhamomyces pijperi]